MHLIRKALSWNDKIVYEVLVHHRANLPNKNIHVSWEKDGEFIVGTIRIGKDEFMTQGKSAREFVEMVNDAIYAVYDIPPEYADQLGGNFRLLPNEDDFRKLDDAAVRKSSLDFSHLEVPA
ncbi:hypothetical protein JW899_04980 [Candidatus Uhrbacteria bacterium]|nr:hypothetical protein [Candidatus Uhrbacteria bacterium]